MAVNKDQAAIHRAVGNLVYLSWYGDLGGGELRLLDHIQGTKFPHKDITVVLGENGSLVNRVQAFGCSVLVSGWHGSASGITGLLARRLGRWRLDRLFRTIKNTSSLKSIVVCNTYPDLNTGGRLAVRRGLTVIWRARADTFVPWGIKLEQRQELVRFLNENVFRVAATTRYEAEAMLEAGVNPTLVEVIPNGIPLNTYNTAQDRGQDLRAHLNISQEALVIAFVARMVPQKGYEVFLRAVAKVRGRVPQIKVIIAGDTTLYHDGEPYKKDIYRLVEQLGLAESVHFLGFMNDIPAVMTAADLFVHASLKEPFGTVLVEAMAASRPVIAADLPGPREIVLEGQTGLFHQAGSDQELALAIEQLALDRDLRIRLGKAGYKRAATYFDANHNLAILDNLCLEAIAAGR
ncbi:glycosyl transferase group 1 family protein [Candidatus Nitrosoglobus terrae]|uniref:Glycosyl transferase group 1 family protein n=1 Tax=Candidatus Nitrosoglobus terrae TaxID=1630141 RepID=A0A1Q2SN94_9GAMM|nr:glycosyltransferase family 4 protein [Candidatus Nitrosoglobus terrae]BAW80577.1 glycosyl transferase group 1 family protein [Candidatus Nitrosoglobus terrae]